MTDLDWRGWYSIATVLSLIGVLVFTSLPADVVFVGAVTALLVSGVITPAEAFAGFSNEGVLSVAALYVVVAGVRETGGVQWIVQNILGQPRTDTHAQIRLTLPVTVFSAFLNNTPVVAMLIPAVSEWAKRFKLDDSRLFIPLSYAAILGGTCTLIGTSTNLVVNGLLIRETGSGLGFFAITPVGVPVALAGIAVLALGSRWLLPTRKPVVQQLENVREYTIEMLVDEGGGAVGKTIEQAGLRHLPGCYLIEIHRGSDVLSVVGPEERLEGGDRLVFVGMVDSIVDLQRIRGLTPATNQVFKLGTPRTNRILVEAVVSDRCPVLGVSIRDGQFRTRYGAVVIAVSRNGERVTGKVGSIVLRAGDTLLLEAGRTFIDTQRLSRDFYLVRGIEGSALPRHDRAGYAAAILLAMVCTIALGLLSTLEAALLAAAAMGVFRCVSMAAARAALDWPVLIVIACAFGVSNAVQTTGVGEVLAHGIVGLAGGGPFAALAALYVATALLSAVVTNNAAAALMFPIAIALAAEVGLSVVPVAITIMLAASASFATPMGYQTNLMVMAAGGYRFVDYIRAGVPLTIVTGAVTLMFVGLLF